MHTDFMVLFSKNHKHFYLSPADCFSFSHFLSPDRPAGPRFFSFQCVPHASHDRYSQQERNHGPVTLGLSYEKEEAEEAEEEGRSRHIHFMYRY